MAERHDPDQRPPIMRAALLRGLVQPPIADDRVPLGLGAAAALAACGSKGKSPTPRPARPPADAPPAAQDLSDTEKVVNWSNWTEYIDVVDDEQDAPDPRRLHQEDRHQGQLHRGLQRQRRVLRQGAPAARGRQGHRPRRLVQHRLDGRPADPPGLRAEARPRQHPQRHEPRAVAEERRVRPGPRLLAAVAERLRRHRLQPRGHRRQEDRDDRPSCSPTRRSRARSPSSPRCATPSASCCCEHGQGPGQLHRRRLRRRHRRCSRRPRTPARSRASPATTTPTASTKGDIAACVAWTGDVVQLQFDNDKVAVRPARRRASRCGRTTSSSRRWPSTRRTPRRSSTTTTTPRSWRRSRRTSTTSRRSWAPRRPWPRTTPSTAEQPAHLPQRRGPLPGPGLPRPHAPRRRPSTPQPSPTSPPADGRARGRRPPAGRAHQDVRRRSPRCSPLDLDHPAGLVLRPARPLGLRQDDDAADGRRPRGPHRGPDPHRRHRHHRRPAPTSATSTRSSSPTRSSRT